MIDVMNIPCTTQALTNASVKSRLCVAVSPSKYLASAVYQYDSATAGKLQKSNDRQSYFTTSWKENYMTIFTPSTMVTASLARAFAYPFEAWSTRSRTHGTQFQRYEVNDLVFKTLNETAASQQPSGSFINIGASEKAHRRHTAVSRMGDFNGNNYNDKFIGDLVNFVASDKFQTMFETYFLAHAMQFTNDEEHRLEYYEMYQNFHEMFDKQLEDFCRQQDITQAEFMKRCRAASTQDEKAKHYIDILLSSVEYETFVKLMKIMRPVAEMRASAAKTISSPKTAEGKGGGQSSVSPAKMSSKESGEAIKAEEKPSTGAPADSKGSAREDKFASK